MFYSQTDIRLMSWSTSGTYIAAVNTLNNITLWNTNKKTLVHTYDLRSEITNLAWSPENNSFAVAWHGGLEIYNVADRRKPIAAYSTGRSPQIAWIGEDAYSSNSLIIFHDSGADSVQHQTHSIVTYDNVPTNVTQASVRPDGERVAVVSNDTEIHILDMAQIDSAIVFSASDGKVHTLDWSPDGHYIVTGDEDGYVHIWDAQTGESIHFIQQERRINYVEWSPAGDKIAFLTDTLSIWELYITSD